MPNGETVSPSAFLPLSSKRFNSGKATRLKSISLTPVSLASRKPGGDESVKRLRAFRGRLPADFKFDRDEANAR